MSLLCDVCVVCGIPLLFAGPSEAQTALFRLSVLKEQITSRFRTALQLFSGYASLLRFPIWSRSALLRNVQTISSGRQKFALANEI